MALSSLLGLLKNIPPTPQKAKEINFIGQHLANHLPPERSAICIAIEGDTVIYSAIGFKGRIEFTSEEILDYYLYIIKCDNSLEFDVRTDNFINKIVSVA